MSMFYRKIKTYKPFEIGKTYVTKFQTGEKFTITDIVWSYKTEGKGIEMIKVKDKMLFPIGFFEYSPEITNCLFNFERLIPETIEDSKEEISINEIEGKFLEIKIHSNSEFEVLKIK